MPVKTLEVDILIVGAGPVGLYGAYYCGERTLSCAVVDSLSEVGGQVTAMYPEKQIYDVAGFPAVTGRDLVRGLSAQASQRDPSYLLGQEAQQLEKLDDGRFRVTTTRSEVVAGAVIVTGGIGTFTPRPLPAGEEYLGRGLEYFVPSSQEYVGRDVLIVGGGDSAIDWALMLEPLARQRHAGAPPRPVPGTRRQRREGQAARRRHGHQRPGHRARGRQGPGAGGGHREGRGRAAGLECDKVVAALGFTANLGPLREWGLELADNRHLVVDTAMRTNVPGVFAAGDITEYDGKVRLISVGFGEVATAVNNAAVHLDPTAHVFPGHTSNEPHDVPVPA